MLGIWRLKVLTLWTSICGVVIFSAAALPAHAEDGPGGLSYQTWSIVLLLLLLQSLIIILLQRSRLSNKRAKRNLKDQRVALEEGIAERTAMLNRINGQLEAEIAEHEATEIRLRETQDYLNSIINALPSILIVVSHAGRISHWNHAAEQETGIPVEEALGQAVSAVFPELPVTLDMIRASLDAGLPYTRDSVQQIKDGEIHFIDISIYPLIAVQAIGAVIRVDDVTARVRMENMMIQNEKMMSLGELAAGMAHEINNPLSAILHGVQNIHRRTSPEFSANQQMGSQLNIDVSQVQEYLKARKIDKILDDIREAGERSAGIVTNMLEFSRASSRAHSLIQLDQVISHTLELSQNLLEQDDAPTDSQPLITTDMEPDLPPVLGSTAELQQVLLNLLRNASQSFVATRDVPRSITTLRLYRDNNDAVIEVIDNGSGMTEAVRRHIFEPFFTTKDVGKGTGLGLSVSYFIITEHHAGTIEVESAPGHGSRFIIRLPLAVPSV